MNVTEYLKRIESESLLSQLPSPKNLLQLQSNHLQSITFENFDTVIQRSVNFNLNAIYEKVVRKQRGGFCFELNYLFSWLLGQLGYNVRFVSCRVFSTLNEKFSNWYSHVGLIVSFDDNEYLVDVGFSFNFKYPIELICKMHFLSYIFI